MRTKTIFQAVIGFFIVWISVFAVEASMMLSSEMPWREVAMRYWRDLIFQNWPSIGIFGPGAYALLIPPALALAYALWRGKAVILAMIVFCVWGNAVGWFMAMNDAVCAIKAPPDQPKTCNAKSSRARGVETGTAVFGSGVA